MIVELDSLAHLDTILVSEESRNLKQELVNHANGISSQLLDRAYCTRPEVG